MLLDIVFSIIFLVDVIDHSIDQFYAINFFSRYLCCTFFYFKAWQFSVDFKFTCHIIHMWFTFQSLETSSRFFDLFVVETGWDCKRPHMIGFKYCTQKPMGVITVPVSCRDSKKDSWRKDYSKKDLREPTTWSQCKISTVRESEFTRYFISFRSFEMTETDTMEIDPDLNKR